MESQPNILLFLMDACQAAALEEGNGCITPNFDRLRDGGVQFQRAYCPSPTCSPSRASLMTGLLPHNHGVLEVEHGRDSDQCNLRTDKPHWARRLREAGYRTGYFGKWHIERSNQLDGFGWSESAVKGVGHHSGLGKGIDLAVQERDLVPELSRYHSGPEGYRDILHYGVSKTPVVNRYPHITSSQAIDFIGRARGEAPWCLCASFSEPNEALIANEEIFARYDVDRIELPPNLRDPMEGKPGLYRRQREIAESLSDEEWKMARACYFSRITELDQEFGRLRSHLEESGEWENTVVIVTSDHGRYVGGHGFDAHNFGPFEEIYRVPLLVSGPGIQEGATSDAFVGLHDLCPTILELAGAEPIDAPDSCSFADVVTNGEAGKRKGAYAEYHGTRFPLAQRIWWEGDFKFVFNGFDFDELYDLSSDPYELENLAAHPDQQYRVKQMMGEIWREIRETGDRTLEETHYFSMRFATVGPEA